MRWQNWSEVIKILLFLILTLLYFVFQAVDMKETSDPRQIKENYNSPNTGRLNPVQYDMQISVCTDEFLKI